MSNTLFKLKRSAVKGKAPTTSNLDLGELAINTNDGRIFFKTTDSASSSSIVTLRQISGGTGITETNGEISITDTGVSAGNIGSSTSIPVLTVNAQGQITAIDSATVAGVSAFAFDSASATLTLSTADGGTFNARIGLQSFSTTDLSEGTNLYYTTARADSDFDVRLATKTTSDIAQGSNLYYSDSSFNISFAGKSTDDLSQGSTNLYYDSATTTTTARYAIGVSGDALSYNAATGTITYSEVAYSGFDSDFAQKTTFDLTEGSNLYFTDARARSAVSVTDNGGDGSFSYDSVTGVFSYTGPSASEVRAHFSAGTGIGITNGQISTSITQYTDADARGAISVTDAGGDGSLSYDSATGIITYTGPSATEVRSHFSVDGDLTYDSARGRFSFTERTDAQVRGLVSAVDAGGDGSFSYNNTNGQFTYTGPSASETRAHFSGGTGVTITDGSVAIAQSVGTTDDVVFGKVTVDSAQVDCLHLSKLPAAPNSLRGLLYYDSDPQSGLSFIPTTNELVEDITINIGQEHLIYVHNLTGAQINNGDAVYISGTAHGVHPQVTLAKADAASTAVPTGIATMNIPNGNHGYITQFGLVRGLNTTGMSEGATAYLSKDSAGKWSTTEVSVDSGYPTHLGTVISVDGSEGSLLVNIVPEHFEYLRVQDKIVVGDELVAPDIYTSHIHFDGTAPGYYAEGLVFYDSSNGALVVKNDEEDVTLQVGQEEWLRIYNNSGSTITNGTPVYISGENSGTPTIGPANATVEAESHVAGVATHDIENGTTGYITVRGIVNDVDTSSVTAGQRVHVAANGTLQNAAPEFPYYACDIGICLVSDASVGKLYVDIQDHTFETIRVTGNSRFDADVTIGGNLNVIGVTSEVISQSLTTSGNLLQLLDGDTVGTAYQNTGGLNDATFKGKYLGDSDLFYFVRMVSVDSAGVGDVIEWGISDSDLMSYGSYNGTYGYGKPFDSDASGITSWNLKDDGLTAALRDGISIQFINLSGHDSADVWCAHPTELNLDLGVIGNYNQQNEPIKYAGVVRDATDERWKFFDEYPAANVDSSSSQFDINFDSASFADIQFATAYGNLSGNATTATTATQLANSRNFSLSGDITSAAVGFNGTGNVTLTTSIGAGVIVNADINASAAIADTKLATISTTGKVQNSATTATSSNTGSTIVARDGSGNFTAGTITANLTGNVTGTVSDLSNHDSAIRSLFSVDNSGLGYDSATGQFSLLNPGVDSASTLALFSAANTGTGYGTLSYSSGQFSFAKVTDANIRSAISAGTGISITSGEISTTITQYTDTLARNAISHNNTGTGFGSIGYNSGTGTINYNVVTTQNIRDQFSVTGDIGYDSSTGQFSVNETYSTANELLTAVKTVDGSGSGLDADELDGQQGSYYRINVYNSVGTLLN